MTEHITKSVVVGANVGEVFRLWENFENFPRFMKNIRSVVRTDDRTSHWIMEGPLGQTLEWDAVTTRLEPDHRIAWNSKDGGDLKTSGQVVFGALPDNQTALTVSLAYVPPGGRLGAMVFDLFKEPEKRLEEDLRNFKHYAERA